MVNGWVKLHRKSLDNAVFKHDPTAWRVFEALLLLADKNGTWSGGRDQLALTTGFKPTTCYQAVLRLKKAQMVDITSNNRFSVYHICKWEEYQAHDDSSVDNQMTTKRQPNDTLIRIKNKNKELVSKDTMSVSQPTTSKTLLMDLIKALGYSDKVRVTPGRLRKLRVRLKTYTAAELLKAATNIEADPFMNGDNDGGVKYGNIDYLLRDDEKVDKWLQRGGGSPASEADQRRLNRLKEI